MLYVYGPRSNKWHGFQGNYNKYVDWKKVEDWCKKTGNLVQIRDQQYIDYLFSNVFQPEKYIKIHEGDTEVEQQCTDVNK